MSNVQAAKSDMAELEMVDKDRALIPDELPLPENISHLNGDEIKTLEKKLVRRLDMFLLPTVAFLFLLNILDR